MWRSRIGAIWASFWIIPTLFAVGSIGLAILLAWLDEWALTRLLPSMFSGGPDGARAVLSTIASSMITFTALVFSITIVVLQLTSSQFSPRVLRTFLRDRLTQIALGVFIATFVYALTVLRSVRGLESGRGKFVPQTAVTISFLFVLLSVAVFIVYINHIANSIRVACILASVGAETRSLIERRSAGPVEVQRGVLAPGPVLDTIRAPRSGYVVWVREKSLVRAAREAGCLLVLVPRVGDFVAEGTPLLNVCPPARGAAEPAGVSARSGSRTAPAANDLPVKALTRAVGISVERTMDQDVAFGLRQLADIAERALSPSMNDETTAVQAIDQIHDTLHRIVTAPLERRLHRDSAGCLRLVVPERELADFLRIGFDGINRHSTASPRVLGRLRSMLLDLYGAARPEHRGLLLRRLALVRLEGLPESDDC